MKTINIIGYGNVGYHLVNTLLSVKEYTILNIYSRTPVTSNTVDISLFVNDLSQLQRADLTIIAVTDSAIEKISSLLPYTDELVVHTSGSFSLDGLNDKNRKGVFYPLQTFSKTKAIDFSNVPICLETKTTNDYQSLEKLGHTLSQTVVSLNSEQRKHLHLTAVFVSNFVNHMFTIGKEIADENNIPFHIFYPLIEETVAKIKTLEPKNAQTGPAIRADYTTIEQHLLKINNDNYKNIYKLLTNSIIQNGKKL